MSALQDPYQPSYGTSDVRPPSPLLYLVALSTFPSNSDTTAYLEQPPFLCFNSELFASLLFSDNVR